MNTPNLDLSLMPQNTMQPSVPFNESMQWLDALVQLVIQSAIVTTPPTTTAADAGKCWAVAPAATGAWAGKDGAVALCTGAGLWSFATPRTGWRGYNLATSSDYRYDGTAWVAA